MDYDDGLTDKQWEKKLIEYEEGISSPSSPNTSPSGQKRKRSKGKRMDEDMADPYAVEDEESTPGSKRKANGMSLPLPLL